MELQWPLILFTTLLAWSAGLFATQGFFALRKESPQAQLPSLIASAVLMAVGGIAVFFHLQHWERIFNGFGHITSGITQELIAVVVIAVVMVAYFVCIRRSKDGALPSVVAALAILSSVVLVVVAGHSYMMAARPAWDSVVQVLSLVGAGAAMGAGTFAAIDGLTSEAANAGNGLVNLAASAVNIVCCVLFIGVMAAATSAYAQVGYHFDMTHPTHAMVDVASYSPFAAGNVAVTVIAIAASVAGLAAAFAGKRTKSWKVWGAVCAVCACASAIALRVLFYQVGGSVFALY